MDADGILTLNGIVPLTDRELAKTYYASGRSPSFDIFSRGLCLVKATIIFRELGIVDELKRTEEEILALTNRIQSIENQKRMDISYALASEDVKKILNLLVNKITLTIDEVATNIAESDVLNVVCDLCKARLANLKGKKLMVTSLGLKVAKKLQILND